MALGVLAVPVGERADQRDHFSEMRASLGRCSQMWVPGVRVRMGLNSPRTSMGASGFMSKLSCCANPPERKM